MKTIYVNLKQEVTAFKEMLIDDGVTEVYRVRMNCNCHPNNNRRSGILVINGSELRYKVIRCKACAGKEAEDGTV